MLIYNNTLVDNDTRSRWSKPKPGSKLINNILLRLSSGTQDVDQTGLDGMVARNNYFGQGNPGGDYAHAGNRFTGLRIAKMSGWRALTSLDQVSWRDFVLATALPSSVPGTRSRRKATGAKIIARTTRRGTAADGHGWAHVRDARARRPMAPTALTGT